MTDTITTTLGALLHPAYEPGDGSADGAQLVGCQWWHPVMGCDSLQIVVDNAGAILTRFARPAVAPKGLSEAFAIVQEQLDQLTGDQELMIYRWPDGKWTIEHTNTSPHVQLGEVSGEYTSNGLTLERAVCNLAALLPENNTSQTEAP